MFDNIKIAFFDLDGTLTNSNKIISTKNKNALLYLKSIGIKIAFCSGRWDSYTLDYDKDLNVLDYVICNNGAQVLDIKNKLILKEDLFTNNVINIVNNYCVNNNLKVIYNSLFKQYNKDNIKYNNDIYQAIVICSTKQDVDNIKSFCINNNLNITYISSSYYKNVESSSYTININLKITNKGDSIKYLLNTLNIDKKDSICFGDNDNDIDMFNNCGIRIAMENGLKELKEMADYITISNDDDGVAYFIDKYIKQG